MRILILFTWLCCAIGAHAGGWQYSDATSKMDGTTSRIASVVSSNTIELATPSPATLALRSGDGQPVTIFLSVRNGQFLIGRYDVCLFRVRFDDDKAAGWGGQAAGDGSVNVITINRQAEFIARLKTAKKLLIEVPFYQRGTHIIEFDTAGLVWP